MATPPTPTSILFVLCMKSGGVIIVTLKENSIVNNKNTSRYIRNTVMCEGGKNVSSTKQFTQIQKKTSPVVCCGQTCARELLMLRTAGSEIPEDKVGYMERTFGCEKIRCVSWSCNGNWHGIKRGILEIIWDSFVLFWCPTSVFCSLAATPHTYTCTKSNYSA